MDELVYFYPNGHEKHQESGHPERPERIEVIKNALMQADLWEKYPKLSPYIIPEEILQSVHSAQYLNLLELTCRRGGHLDMDTYTTPYSWDLALNSAGGAVSLASAIYEGRARRGFALTRPPGHHAMHGQGMGFCLLNNIAMTAEYLLKMYKIEHLAIVDIDLHHGNGTEDIFWRRNDVLYISTHQAPFYPGTGSIDDIGADAGEGWTANFPLSAGSGNNAFLTIVDELILPLLDRANPQMLLVSYGFDAHWLDPLGQLLLTADGYGSIIRKLCQWADNNCAGRVGLFLEGGYDLRAGEACSLAVIRALLGQTWEDPLVCPYQENDHWKSIIQRSKSIWRL